MNLQQIRRAMEAAEDFPWMARGSGCKPDCLSAYVDEQYDDMCDDCYDEVVGGAR